MNVKIYAELTACVGFILLFPGFFLWHWGMATSLIPVSIGLFREVSVVIAVGFISVFFMQWANTVAKSPFAMLVMFFLVYCSLWTMLHAGLSPPPGAVFQSIEVLTGWFVLLSVGAFLDIERKWFRIVLTISWLLMAVIVLSNLNNLQFIPHQAFDVQGDNVANYQSFARSIMISSVPLLALIQVAWKRILFSIFTIIILFFAAARSELYGLILAIGMVELFQSIRHRYRMLFLFVLFIVFVFIVITSIDLLLQSRQMQILNLSESTSWIARQDYQYFAFQQIKESPILGVFGGHYFADEFYRLGAYSHNALSAWVQFGLIGFIIYISIAIWAAASSALRLVYMNDARWRFSLYLNASSLILIIFAKAVFWPFVALGWGVFIRQTLYAGRHGSHQDN